MARPSPSCAHDDDRLRLPAASPSRSNSAEKKESTDPRLSQLCPPYVTPSSSSSLEYHRSDARIVENGFAAGSGMSNSAKVGLGRVLINAQIRFSHPGFPPRPDVLASATWATDRHIYVGKAFEYHRVSRKTRRDRSFFHWARDHDLTHVAFSELLGTKL